MLISCTYSQSSYQCYTGKASITTENVDCLDPRQITQVDVENEEMYCLSVDYHCNMNDSLGFCTDDEMMDEETIKVFSYVMKWNCEAYLNGSIEMMSNVNCCNESLCNVPELGLCAIKKCYNGTYVSKPGCVDPIFIGEMDVIGNEMFCYNYTVDCGLTGDNETCTMEEINENVTKWVLNFGSQSVCDDLKSKFDVVNCCNETQCNTPIGGICDSIDCYVGVSNYEEDGCVDETFIQVDKFKKGDYICASYRYTCTENDTDCSTIENPDIIVDKLAFVAIAPQECAEYKNNSLYKNVSCCDSNLCNGVSVDCFGKQCYAGVTNEDISTGCVDSVGLYHIDQNATYKCISYKYKCMTNDTACTTKEIREGVYKWRFSVSLTSFCLNLILNPYAKNVTCCDDNLCNVPEEGFCPLNDDLECLDGIVTSGKSNCANESLLTTKKVTNSSHVCISYQHRCQNGDKFCTEEERDNGTKKWVFTTGTKYDCSLYEGPKGESYVTCCSTNKCNHPWIGYCGKYTDSGTADTGTGTESDSTDSSTNGTHTTDPSLGTTKTKTSTQTGDGMVNCLSIILLLISYLIV